MNESLQLRVLIFSVCVLHGYIISYYGFAGTTTILLSQRDLIQAIHWIIKESGKRTVDKYLCHDVIILLCEVILLNFIDRQTARQCQVDMQGKARQGKARQGKARQGKARQARQGEARRGEARRGEARRGEARRGEATSKEQSDCSFKLFMCDYSSILCFVRYPTDCPHMAWVNPWLMVFRHLPRVPHYSVVVNIMKFYRHTNHAYMLTTTP